MISSITSSPFIFSDRTLPFGAMIFPRIGFASSRLASFATSPPKSDVAPRQNPPLQNLRSVDGICDSTFRSNGSGYVGTTTESRTTRSTFAG